MSSSLRYWPRLKQLGPLFAILLLVSHADGRAPAVNAEEGHAKSVSRDASEDEISQSLPEGEEAGAADDQTPAAAESPAQEAEHKDAQRPSKPNIVWLAAHEPTTDHPEFFSELLTRELVRQALLVAVRDGLCLSTRDVVLREAFPEDGSEDSAGVLHISTHGTADAELQIKLWRRGDDQRKELWNKRIALTTDPFEFYFPLVRAMEETSRGELVEVLRKAGYEGSPTAAGEVKPRPETEKSLAECTLSSQLLAVREAHAQIQLEGESLQLIGALARGYAHLGYMSQHYWNAMCKVFQARSLLYAERLVATRPDAAFPLWVRGYARAWAGLHAAALADFAQADQLAKTTAEETPEWVRMAELHCRYDFAALRTLADADKPWSELARLLAFMDLARGGGDANTIEAGEATLGAIPEAYLIYDRLCDFGGVGYGHVATVRGSSALAKHLPPRLATMRGLSDDVKQRLPAAPAARSILALFGPGESDAAFSDVPSRTAQALIENEASSDDRGEPSWIVLGRMIQEEDFALTVRRALFLKQRLGVPVDDFVAAVSPNLDGHPYAAWIESLAIDKDNDPAKYRDALLRVKIGDLYWREYPFLRDADSIPLANHETGSEIARRLYRRMDLIALDAETLLYWYGGDTESIKKLTPSFLPISPHSPRFIAAMAEHADADKAQLESWERDFGRHVWVLSRLARRFVAKKQFADAERCLKRRIELSADQDGFEELAEIYLQQGDDERWRTTLEECLRFPDYGLSHAWIQVRIARHYMEQREYEKARPYAEQAAQTWASWAMSCASESLEALRKWDSSEEWARNDAVRYPESRLKWYFWCRRTGHGDIKAAKSLAQELVDEYSARNPPAKQDWIGIFHLLNGQRKLAYDAFQADHDQTRNYWSGFHVILLADELGETVTRDRVLNFFVKAGVPEKTASTYALAKFAVLLHDAYRGSNGELDLAALDEILDATTENQRMDIAYFAGRFLALRGRAEDSERYLKRCYASTEISQLNRTLAAAELLDAGYGPADLKGPND